MNCKEKYFSNHILHRIIERGISPNDVRFVIEKGEIIKQYENDKPYPSVLILGMINNLPLHVVVSKDEFGNCYLITAYIPTESIWNIDFKTKLK
jgi:hypothetical protein